MRPAPPHTPRHRSGLVGRGGTAWGPILLPWLMNLTGCGSPLSCLLIHHPHQGTVRARDICASRIEHSACPDECLFLLSQLGFLPPLPCGSLLSSACPPSCCLARPSSSCEVPMRTYVRGRVQKAGAVTSRGQWDDLGQETPVVACACLPSDPGRTHPRRPLSSRLPCLPRPQSSLLS